MNSSALLPWVFNLAMPPICLRVAHHGFFLLASFSARRRFSPGAVPQNFLSVPGQTQKIDKSNILQHDPMKNQPGDFSEPIVGTFFSPYARSEKTSADFFATDSHKNTSLWVRVGVPWANYSQGILK